MKNRNVKLKIKVCGLTNPENIIALNNTKADCFGFILTDKSPRFIKPADLNTIVLKVKPGINKIGVFVNESTDNIRQIVTEAGIDYVQLHGEESPDFCKEIRKYSKVIKVFSVDHNLDINRLKPYQPYCDLFLFDSKSDLRGGSGKKFDWQVLQKYALGTPFMLSGGICPDDAKNITAMKNPDLWGIDINSCFEVSPGIKDVEKVNDFINRL